MARDPSLVPALHPMDNSEVSPEWEVVSNAQQQKDILTKKAIALPIEKFRELPYRPPAFPADAAIVGEEINITEEWVTVRDGTSIALRVYTPIPSPERSILIFNSHGGGFVVGTTSTEEGQNRVLTKNTRCITVSVDYRRAPEYPYPYAVNDCFDALLWCKSNSEKLKIDPDRILLVGGSAGANISTVLALKFRDLGIPGIIGQILNIPVTCHPEMFPADKYALNSYERNKDAAVLSSDLMRWFWKQYLPNPTDDPHASPLLEKSLAGLPQTLIQVAGWDPLHDEGVAYAQALQEAGVPTTLKVFKGLPHAFYSHPQLPSTAVYFTNMVEWVKEHFL
ncbi:alpha/beta hydrolase fold-domain-containing protein [Aspergillus unguis]